MERIRNVVLVVVCALAGCYCWQPAHQSEAKCIVAQQFVDCTHQSVNLLEPAALTLVADLIGGTLIDWTVIEQRLEAFGFKDAGCLLAVLESDFLTISPSSNERRQRIHGELAILKHRHHAENVRFRIRRADGSVVES